MRAIHRAALLQRGGTVIDNLGQGTQEWKRGQSYRQRGRREMIGALDGARACSSMVSPYAADAGDGITDCGGLGGECRHYGHTQISNELLASVKCFKHHAMANSVHIMELERKVGLSPGLNYVCALFEDFYSLTHTLTAGRIQTHSSPFWFQMNQREPERRNVARRGCDTYTIRQPARRMAVQRPVLERCLPKCLRKMTSSGIW